MKRPDDNILRVENVVKSFHGVTAVSDVSFDVKRGSIKAIIGPNGAGKTTLLNVISGIMRPNAGRIYFNNNNITALPPPVIALKGIGRTFQLIKLFSVNNASVLDNVLLGANRKLNPGILKSLLLRSRMNKQERSVQDTALKILKFVGLGNMAHFSPLALSFGSQRMVELARSLIGEPALLLLDEPASGLNDVEVENFRETLLAIQQAWGITILLIEHNMKLVMTVAEDIVVVDFGQKIAEGTPAEIGKNPQVIRAYLGEDYMKREVVG